MTTLAFATERLTLVSLLGDARPPLVTRLLGTPAFRDIQHIAVHGQTPAQRNVTAARIDAAITGADRAVLLVAQGAGCAAAAWWARLSPASYVTRVAGALLIAPDTTTADRAAFASPRSALPFPSVVIGADDASQRMAAEWGSRLIDGPLSIGQRETSGRFQSMIARFTAAIVDHDVRAAERMIATVGDR